VIPAAMVALTGWSFAPAEMEAGWWMLLKRRRSSSRLMMPRLERWNVGLKSGEGGVADSWFQCPLAI